MGFLIKLLLRRIFKHSAETIIIGSPGSMPIYPGNGRITTLSNFQVYLQYSHIKKSQEPVRHSCYRRSQGLDLTPIQTDLLY